ncbi:GMC family oxidoreductase N-terminal domain-containing protein [Pelagibacteraceae bacterium]|nr:GMC family oxidoreductase N-terminal domain-containing protein [Pelagibacteraceae bacterium]
MSKQYDFIIVGGGTSGIITATKLVEQGASVLVLEEGSKSNSLLLSMPAGWIKGLENSPHLRFYKSIKQTQLNGRQHDIAQAKTLGGGSKINGMVYMRGKPSDYDRWQEETGDVNWNWNSILKNFIRLENNERINNDYHGNAGNLKVSDPGYIAKGSNLYIKTMQELGLPYNSDFNDGDQYGVGFMQYTIGNGKRCDVVSAFLNSIKKNKNIQINLNSVVTKILIEKNKAVGVECISKNNKIKFFANDIILTAGALVTPKILMHSGIGEEKQLKKFNIDVIENLKGVGKNLQDHHEVPVISKTKPGYGYFNQDKGWRMIKNGLQYLLFNSGPVRSQGVDCCSFLNPEDLTNPNDPKIKLYCVPIMYMDRDIKGVKSDHGLTLTPCIMNPKARGEIKIQSSNPMDLPLINPNFLSNEEDIKTILQGVKLARRVIKTKPLSDIVVKEFLPGRLVDSDNDLVNYCKKMIKTNWHPVGTCKMGKDNDEMAVLNTKLEVRGIKNLRVFDVSMMPTIVAANTNAPAMAIADKATDMLLGNQ